MSPEIGEFSYEHARGLEAERAGHLDDFATWAAEALHGSMRSTFRFTYERGDLLARDGRSLHDVFYNSIESADELAAQEPRLQFERRRRMHEYEEYEDMLRVATGKLPNTMVVVSDFPAELMSAHEDVGGYNVDRKTAFLRVITKEPSGEIAITSQTLDQSDRAGLEAIYQHFGLTPDSGELLGQRMYVDLEESEQDMLTDRLTGVYDETLHRQYNGEWYAGLPGENRHDTYAFVQAQRDLLDVFVEAKLQDANAAEYMRGDIIAAIDARYQRRGEAASGEAVSFQSSVAEAVEAYTAKQELLIEIDQAGKQAAADNKTYSGCGITVSQDDEPDSLLEALGFGSASAEDKYGSLKFTCQKGHVNTRPRNQLIDKCKICGTDVKC